MKLVLRALAFVKRSGAIDISFAVEQNRKENN